jgi:holliday junction DNA helicase RuvA
MIGKLKGLVDSVGGESLILDVNGVGYVVAASTRTLRGLPPPGQAIALHIETQVREDAIRLFGFLAEAERDWFRLLQGVQGVGAKVALAILGVLSAAELANAIASQDKAMVARAPGVGPKLATRIVVELKDKAPTSDGADLRGGGVAEGAGDEALAPGARDAVLALVNLGYARPQAALAVARGVASLGAGAEAAALIRRGLKELAQ